MAGAERSEALAQLARMLGDPALAGASDAEAAAAVAGSFDRLRDALLDETAASDDVADRESALSYVEHRLDFLAAVIDDAARARLRAELAERIDAW